MVCDYLAIDMNKDYFDSIKLTIITGLRVFKRSLEMVMAKRRGSKNI